MPTLRALECLVAVLDAGSITDAATALHMSQPALSHQLAALEKELGVAVVERLPRGVRATVAGRAIEADARVALAAGERVVETGRAVARGGAGQLRIACAESMTASLLAPVLRQWRRRHPDIRIALVEETRADALVRQLESGQADLAVGPRPTRWTGHSGLIGYEEVVVVLPQGHPLADRPAITFVELENEPIVHYDPENGLAAWLDSVAAHHGVVLTVAMRTRQAVTAAQLAAAGVGVAIVPRSAIHGRFAGVAVPMDPPLGRDVVCLVANPSDVVARRFETAVIGRGVRVS
ncbi:LysR family transcriptional regulator [Kutzneria buriramensis]|uniref:DNA-binding transcriptional LysR family regulator n=1 Tax=Kutzneria buriramensis TaxID=1045776 RepID=A0A3E0GU46_9PSEU|nr:LysR family transcriptional regulator [Kutzneria buriramensis]REH27080.1 DNA-binding transcriptional LysR family regulator [Kutzneria buriramensis]